MLPFYFNFLNNRGESHEDEARAGTGGQPYTKSTIISISCSIDSAPIPPNLIDEYH